MGYRVEYRPLKKVRGLEKRFLRSAAVTAAFVLVFVFLIIIVWPEATDVINKVLFPGDPAVTAAALEDLTDDLLAGQTLRESLKQFCFQILKADDVASGQ